MKKICLPIKICYSTASVLCGHLIWTSTIYCFISTSIFPCCRPLYIPCGYFQKKKYLPIYNQLCLIPLLCPLSRLFLLQEILQEDKRTWESYNNSNNNLSRRRRKKWRTVAPSRSIIWCIYTIYSILSRASGRYGIVRAATPFEKRSSQLELLARQL